MALQKPANKHFGIELTSVLAHEASEFLHSLDVQHLQVTLPGAFSLSKISELRKDFEIVVHSNLLNTLGENDWPELRQLAKTISSIAPMHIVEHFTLFRSENGSKFGIPETAIDKAILEKAVSNIVRWQDELGCRVAIENAPVTEHVDEYFDALINVRDQTGCLIVCDVPHFIISSIAAGWSEEQTEKRAKQLNPIQIHVAGLSVRNGKVFDNHKSLEPRVLSIANKLFPETQIVTLEQSPFLPGPAVKKMLATARDTETIAASDLPTIEGTLSGAEANVLLSEVTWTKRTRTSASKIDLDALPAFLRSFEKFSTFYYPFLTLMAQSDDLPAKDMLRISADLMKRVDSFQSWQGGCQLTVSVAFGESDKVIHRKAFLTSTTAAEQTNRTTEFQISNKQKQWIKYSIYERRLE